MLCVFPEQIVWVVKRLGSSERVDGEDHVFVGIRVMKASDEAERWTCMSDGARCVTLNNIPGDERLKVLEL